MLAHLIIQAKNGGCLYNHCFVHNSSEDQFELFTNAINAIQELLKQVNVGSLEYMRTQNMHVKILEFKYVDIIIIYTHVNEDKLTYFANMINDKLKEDEELVYLLKNNIHLNLDEKLKKIVFQCRKKLDFLMNDTVIAG